MIFRQRWGNGMYVSLSRLTTVAAIALIVPHESFASPNKIRGIGGGPATASVMAVPYVPANKSTIPAEHKAWESSANDIIKIVGTAARRATNAADIYYEAIRAGLDMTTVFVLVELLSRFDENMVSSSGNIGLLQLSPHLHTQLGNPENTLYQGKYNLRLGCTILRFYLEQGGGNLRLAISRFFKEAAPQSDPELKVNEFIKLLGVRSSGLSKQ